MNFLLRFLSFWAGMFWVAVGCFGGYFWGYFWGAPPVFCPAVGTPLEVPRVPRPSPELVAHYHELYVQRLQELFERHKVACGVPPETRLIIA